LPTSREADGHHAGKAARAVAQIQTGKLTHNPENASIEVIDGALWLEVDAEIGQHVNYRLIDNEPIALDGVFIYRYIVKDLRPCAPGFVAFRLTR
jgi:hypothetical protein